MKQIHNVRQTRQYNWKCLTYGIRNNNTLHDYIYLSYFIFVWIFEFWIIFFIHARRISILGIYKTHSPIHTMLKYFLAYSIVVTSFAIYYFCKVLTHLIKYFSFNYCTLTMYSFWQNAAEKFNIHTIGRSSIRWWSQNR